MKIRNDYDRKVIEEMIISESGECSPSCVEDFIQRRKTIVDAAIGHKDMRKKLNAKRNWRLNRNKLTKGIHQWQISTAGKQCMRKIHKFNVDNNASGYKGLYTSDFTRDEALKALLSLQTHLIIEAQYCIPDLETHLSTVLMVENALDILASITEKVRLYEELDEEDYTFLKDLTI